ncbi:MAG TPA: multidrug efflux SMR transporter [Aliicoccus persicus]|uniref:Multidrug efflux SMR transporter n=1 Tax=Aliicoccus persicus TaxID=930138 RepID=A0A921JB76_9STAP|nr:multidrug efflux SMR transporter [Aliicoccus persicus]
MGYLLLAGAIVSEVFGTTMMKLTSISKNKKVLALLGVVVGYALSFYALSLALVSIPLSFAYATWSGVGTALTALVGFLVFKEKITVQMAFGILLLIVGIVLMRI